MTHRLAKITIINAAFLYFLPSLKTLLIGKRIINEAVNFEFLPKLGRVATGRVVLSRVDEELNIHTQIRFT